MTSFAEIKEEVRAKIPIMMETKEGDGKVTSLKLSTTTSVQREVDAMAGYEAPELPSAVETTNKYLRQGGIDGLGHEDPHLQTNRISSSSVSSSVSQELKNKAG